ncbi:acyltransferase family protein [Hufsiella arboris]|uniref:acyltransferase family protein n=1 Tax=Hufsiella arboris TaxID=2695275 RepID=UPI0034E2FD4C
MFIASCLMIPYPIVPERYYNLFHLNPPAWSLFWEYVANIVYALVLVKLRNKALWILTVIAALAICYEAHKSGNLGVGWSGENITGGGIRVFYSFLIGMLVYRSNWIIKNSLGFLSVGVLLIIAFLIPYSDKTNWIADPLIVLFYFPFLVALGSGARLRPVLAKLCRFSGEISYPLYMVHYPFIWIFMSYVEKTKPSMNLMTLIMLAGAVLLIGLAYFTMIFLDIPIRKYLKNRMAKSV